jgi:hypothetical protein
MAEQQFFPVRGERRDLAGFIAIAKSDRQPELACVYARETRLTEEGDRRIKDIARDGHPTFGPVRSTIHTRLAGEDLSRSDLNSSGSSYLNPAFSRSSASAPGHSSRSPSWFSGVAIVPRWPCRSSDSFST